MSHSTAVIRGIQVTEKATFLAAKQNQYFFEVTPAANKREIKEAVEAFYKVSVVSVNTMRYIGKSRRERTAQAGKKADWKRAVVTLKAGDQIELA